MVNSLVAFVLVTAIGIAGMLIVLDVGIPALDSAKDAERIRETESVIISIDNAVREVAKEGVGSRRLVKFYSPGKIEVIPEEDAIQYETESTARIVDYLSRKTGKNTIIIGGNDVKCDVSSGNFTVENNFIRARFQRIINTTPLSAINTTLNILSLVEKSTNTEINVTNSSIVIDSNATTSQGIGYSELLRTGQGLPVCTYHVFIKNPANISYDVYYTLYAGADFFIMDTRNYNTKPV